MRGHEHRGNDYWEPAQGMIARVETRQSRRKSDATPEHHYVVDVRLASGSMIRGTVIEQSQVARAVGHTVPVEVHPKNNEIRLDLNSNSSAMTTLAGETVNMPDQIRGMATGIEVTGSGAAGLGGLSSLLGGLGAAGITPGVHMIDASSGQEIQLGAAQGQELQQLAQAMMSGDPAARQAAVERIRQIKAQQAGQAAPPADAASTFDPIGPASTAGTYGQPAQNAYGQPVQDAAFGQSVQDTFGQPTAGSPYGQVTPSPYGQAAAPTSFGAPSAFDSFNPGAGEGTADQRLARLQQLLDKGILTESEYATLRQQILNAS
jgi:hypothetical protein